MARTSSSAPFFQGALGLEGNGRQKRKAAEQAVLFRIKHRVLYIQHPFSVLVNQRTHVIQYYGQRAKRCQSDKALCPPLAF